MPHSGFFAAKKSEYARQRNWGILLLSPYFVL